MTLAPILAAPPAIQLHIAAALVSAVAAACQLLGRKAGLRHRALGWIFVGCMAVTALTSFQIAEVRPGQFSPIHLLSVATLITLPLAIRARRLGQIGAHRRRMLTLVAGLVIAGAFTLLPNRIMGRAVYGLTQSSHTP